MLCHFSVFVNILGFDGLTAILAAWNSNFWMGGFSRGINVVNWSNSSLNIIYTEAINETEGPVGSRPTRCNSTTRQDQPILNLPNYIVVNFEPVMGFINQMRSGKSVEHFTYRQNLGSILNHLGMRAFRGGNC